MTTAVEVLNEDLSASWLERVLRHGYAGIDIETTGLDWRVDRVRTVQVESAGSICVIRMDGVTRPRRLQLLLEEPRVGKIFHHAAFDLRFLAHSWGFKPTNVSCTKVAAKIVRPGLPAGAYSLAPLLRELLKVELDKSLQTSDWSQELTAEQIDYAGNDVRHLRTLLDRLRELASRALVLDLVEASFAYLPTRVELDLVAVGDVFTH